MKSALLLLFISVNLLITGGCRRDAHEGANGIPNPPFAGEPPEEAYVFYGQPGVHGGKMVLAQSGPTTFNPLMITDAPSAEVVCGLVSRSLVDYRNVEVPPKYDAGLATRWESTPDAREWTFHLRKGVKWSDGEPFSANDVMFTYEAVLDENVGSGIRAAFDEGKDKFGKPIYPGIEKLDDHAVRFKLYQSNVRFLDSISSLWLLPEHKLAAVWQAGNLGSALGVSDKTDEILSLGPFRIEEFVSGQRVVLERNPYFWKIDTKGQRLPYLDRIIFVSVDNLDTTLSKFQAGEIDVMPRVRAQDHSTVKSIEGQDLVLDEVGVSFDPGWLAFNQNEGLDSNSGKPFVEPWKLKLFRDQRFRQAVSYAIDREALANTVYSGRAVPIYSFVTPGDRYWHSDVKSYPLDQDRARELLAEIGLKDNNGDRYLETREGHTVEITITTNSESGQRVNTANFIRDELGKIGIKARVNSIDFSAFTKAMEATFDFDAIVSSWQLGIPPGPTTAKNILLSSGAQHVCFPNQSSPSTDWENQVDQLVHKIGVSIQPEQQKQLYAEIQRIWSEQLPVIPLIAQREAIAYKKKFGNLQPTALPPRLTWNAEEIFLIRR